MVKYSDIAVGDAFVDPLSTHKAMYVIMAVELGTYHDRIVFTAVNSQTTHAHIFIGRPDTVLTHTDCEYFSLRRD